MATVASANVVFIAICMAFGSGGTPTLPSRVPDFVFPLPAPRFAFEWGHERDAGVRSPASSLWRRFIGPAIGGDGAFPTEGAGSFAFGYNAGAESRGTTPLLASWLIHLRFAESSQFYLIAAGGSARRIAQAQETFDLDLK